MLSMTWARGLGWGLLAWCAGVALQLQQEALWPLWAYAGLWVLAAVLAFLMSGLWLRFMGPVESPVGDVVRLTFRWAVRCAVWCTAWGVLAFA